MIHYSRQFLLSLRFWWKLAPKIDELRVSITNSNVDVVCITETWLKEHIEDHVVSVAGYHIASKDRKSIEHGIVCTYVRDSIRLKTLDYLMNDYFEVLWLQLYPKRLPRGISSIIVGTVYNPPSANDALMLGYLSDSLSQIEANYPECGLILTGDFNKLNTSRILYAFNIKQIVPFPTRGQSKLDLVLTNLSTYYDVPQKLSPFGLSDHATIKVQPLSRRNYLKDKFVVKSRDTRPINRLTVRKYLEEINLKAMIDCVDTWRRQIQLIRNNRYIRHGYFDPYENQNHH